VPLLADAVAVDAAAVDTATVVWLAADSSASGDPAASDEALAAWARSHGVTLAPVADTEPEGVPIDWTAADAVEAELARVRDALAGLDFDAAERALARAQATLKEHPELPQAAWLRAEVDRGWAARWTREGDVDRAARAWQRAAGLDGGRSAGLGETAAEGARGVAATIVLEGRARGSTLRLDGETIEPGHVTRSEGEHALAIVTPGGRVTWAGWVGIAEGTVVRVRAPEAPACSREDVMDAALADGGVRASGVRCRSWLAVVGAGAGAVRVARCHAGSCGAFEEERVHQAAAQVAEKPRAGGLWPKWATWVIAGALVVGASFAVAAGAGAFHTTTTQETKFVNGGLTVHSAP
jgi:hypothetical protein